MWNRKQRTTTTTSARGLTRRLFLSGEVIDGLGETVPDGKLAIALTSADARIVLVDEPEALQHVFELLDALVLDGSEWRPRTVDPASRPQPASEPARPAGQPTVA
jgi:hypothetical protein